MAASTRLPGFNEQPTRIVPFQNNDGYPHIGSRPLRGGGMAGSAYADAPLGVASQYIRAAFDCSGGEKEPLRTSALEWDTHIVNELCRLFHMMSTQYGLTPGYATKKLRRVRGGGYLHPEVFLCKPGGVMTFDGEVTCGITDPQQHRNLPLLKRPRDTGGAESPQDGFVRRFPKLRRAISRPV